MGFDDSMQKRNSDNKAQIYQNSNRPKYGITNENYKEPTSIQPHIRHNGKQNLDAFTSNGFKAHKIQFDDGKEYINRGEEDQMVVEGYKYNKCRTIWTWVLIVWSWFTVRLLFRWKPDWFVKATHTRCSLAAADKILLIDQYDEVYVEEVRMLRNNAVTNNGHKDMDQSESVAIGDNSMARVHNLLLPDKEGQFMQVDSVRVFENKKETYIWSNERRNFERLKGLDSQRCSYYLKGRGLTKEEQTTRRLLYGQNSIEVLVTPIFKLLYREILNPFYIFQVFSVVLWFFEAYYYYAVCIIIMSTASIISTTQQTRKNERSLRSTIQSTDTSVVWRGEDVYETVPTGSLVPGDVIVIPSHGCIMHCDAVLMSGNCIVNESMLTGESVPVTKTPVLGTDERFDIREHARHTLFGGTHVIQTRFYSNEKVKAVVIRTGFMTAKGSLVRSIMFPKPVDFKFHQDSLKFIGILFCFAGIGCVYTIITMIKNEEDTQSVILRTLDLITIVVPPALPAAMTVGIVFAQRRLKLNRIFCISPRSINISGAINCVCFDKTGTLTEDGLDFWGVVPSFKQLFGSPVRKVEEFGALSSQILTAMASCHSLTVINGVLSGDPLDLKMFEATGWVLEEPEMDETTKFDMITPTVVRPHLPHPNNSMSGLQVGIVRQFPFSSSLQRMAVAVRVLGANHFDVYVKGSPEVIASLAQAQTVPDDFQQVLNTYTKQGYRVLAVGYKALPVKVSFAKLSRIAREEVESDLEFLGLIVLENRLKPQSTGVIRVLSKADIRSIMITGDNLQTALSVARDCEIVSRSEKVILVNASKIPPHDQLELTYSYADMSEIPDYDRTGMKDVVLDLDYNDNRGERFKFALTGKAYAVIKECYPNIIPKLAVRGAVFARMSPDQKQQLIEDLQDVGYYAVMCGDGANDCGALKTANVGISLSEAEASVAAPFTSNDPNVSCVPTLIREGRAAIVTSFGIFKFMACYSLNQFISCIILYSVSSTLSDQQFLFEDLFLITVFAILFGRTQAYTTLVKEPPPFSLIILQPLMSIASQIIFNSAFQLFVFYYVRSQSWYTPKNTKADETPACFENYAVFAVSVFQYISLAVVCSKGPPYRKHIFTNHLLMITLVLLTIISAYIVVYPFPGLQSLFELQMPLELSFRLTMVALAALNFGICIVWDKFILPNVIIRCIDHCMRDIYTKPIYQTLDMDMSANYSRWPPITEEKVANHSSHQPVVREHSVNKPLSVIASVRQRHYSADEIGFRPTDPKRHSANEKHTSVPPPPNAQINRRRAVSANDSITSNSSVARMSRSAAKLDLSEERSRLNSDTTDGSTVGSFQLNTTVEADSTFTKL